jgi:hypothetical protein
MNNPPAFPLHNHGVQTLGMHISGMTLRDYFAAKAMQRLLTSDDIDVSYATAVLCYRMADAMLAARETTKGETHE